MSIRPSRPPDLAKSSFLIVEDFEGMRAILRDMLKRAGATRIDFSSNAATALSQMERKSYDAILCDLNLGPGKTGQQLLEEVRQRQMLPPHTVWLMVSAEKTPGMVTGAMESRPDDYLVKPVSETMLYSRLTRQMAKKRSLAPIEEAIRDREYLRALRLTEMQMETASPHAWDLKRLRAELAMQVGDHALARQTFEEALSQRELPWARLGLAQIHANEGEFEAAAREIKRVTDSNLAYLDAHDWLAGILERQGELEEAQAVLGRALSTSPHVSKRQSRLGEVAYQRGDLDTAEHAFRRAIDLDRQSAHKSVDDYLWLSRTCLAQGNAEGALKALGSLSTDIKQDARASLLARALKIPAHLLSGNREQAGKLAEELKQELQSQAQNLPPEVVFDLAGPLIALGDKATAGMLIYSVVGNNHDHPHYRQRAQAIYTQAGMAEEGEQLLNKAAASATAIMNQGVRLSREGKLEEAIQLTREARKQMPNNPRLLLNHAFLLISWMEQSGRDMTLAQEAHECIETARHLRPHEKRAGELIARLEGVG